MCARTYVYVWQDICVCMTYGYVWQDIWVCVSGHMCVRTYVCQAYFLVDVTVARQENFTSKTML
jgi:hypothetical protein